MSQNRNRIAISILVILALILLAFVYPKIQTKKDNESISTSTTDEEQKPPYNSIQTFTGWVGGDHLQWDYYYDKSSSSLSIVGQHLGGGGWGDGYYVDYAAEMDGLYWNTALKDYPLLAMTFNGEEGLHDDLLFAFHPLILSGELNQITVSGIGTIHYDGDTKEPYVVSKKYSFSTSNGQLLGYTSEGARATYEYDSSGRLTKITRIQIWDPTISSDSKTFETTISYPDSNTIIIKTNWSHLRKWVATINNNNQISSLQFGEVDYDMENDDFTNVDSIELTNIDILYDSEGYLLQSKGSDGIHDGISVINYGDNHELSSFGTKQEESEEVQDGNIRKFFYSHKEAIFDKPYSESIAVNSETISQRIAEQSDIARAYSAILEDSVAYFNANSSDFDVLSTSYYLYDIDKDGTTEMIVYDYPAEPASYFTFYTFENGKAINIGRMDAFHSGLYTKDNLLYSYMTHQGHSACTKITKNGNSISTSELFDDYDDPTYERQKGYKPLSLKGATDLSEVSKLAN